MLKIHQNHSLKNNTTFGNDIVSAYYAEPSSIGQLSYLMQHAGNNNWQFIVIGEGSNLLFIENYEGLVIRPDFRGIQKVDESNSEVLVRAGAGENWDQFVSKCVENNWYGAENLSMIPGSVGAAAVQNIGAYGKEAKDIIAFVELYNIESGETEILTGQACEFGYRDSIFKHSNSKKYIITAITFSLTKKGDFVLDYGNVREEFQNGEKQNLQGLRETIMRIRKSKLPDPAEFGNAGSYFKNPVIQMHRYEQLAIDYPGIPGYPAGPGKMKVPAAWLIETSGWKDIRKGDVGTWPKQPLVIVNYGNASGKEIFAFSEEIRTSVREQFAITLQREVTVI